jgi:membrane protein DedA with SNARE-associated domain
VFADLASDIILYWLGKKYGMKFVDNFGKYIGISERMVKMVGDYLNKHGGKIIVLVKATTGLCQVTWVAAGTVKYDFKRFIKYTFVGGLFWSTFLVTMGYFYGYLWREVAQYIRNAGILIFVLAVITIIGINQLRKYQEKKMFERG